MSERDVADVFYPLLKERTDFQELRLKAAEICILGLRRRLRELDPSLPDEHDGAGWFPLEWFDIEQRMWETEARCEQAIGALRLIRDENWPQISEGVTADEFACAALLSLGEHE